jgi:hypothetical protein
MRHPQTMKIYQFVIPAKLVLDLIGEQESSLYWFPVFTGTSLDSRFHGNDIWDAYVYFLGNPS